MSGASGSFSLAIVAMILASFESAFERSLCLTSSFAAAVKRFQMLSLDVEL